LCKKVPSAGKAPVQIPLGLERVEARMAPIPITLACRFVSPLDNKWEDS